VGDVFEEAAKALDDIADVAVFGIEASNRLRSIRDRLRSEVTGLRAALVEASRCESCKGKGEQRWTPFTVEVVDPCRDCSATGINPFLSPATQAVVAGARAKEVGNG
jgi:DnaJ-class molecular chaperone